MMDQSNRNKFIIKMIFFSFFVLIGCNISQKAAKAKINSNTSIIVYRVFDSLEQLICNRIDTFKNKDSIYILIAPVGDLTHRTYIDSPYKEGQYIYDISLFYKHSYELDTVLRISNRKMQICGKFYPVYFLRIDDVFCQSENRNMPLRHNQISKRVDFYNKAFYVVDMNKKKVLQSTYMNHGYN